MEISELIEIIDKNKYLNPSKHKYYYENEEYSIEVWLTQNEEIIILGYETDFDTVMATLEAETECNGINLWNYPIYTEEECFWCEGCNDYRFFEGFNNGCYFNEEDGLTYCKKCWKEMQK